MSRQSIEHLLADHRRIELGFVQLESLLRATGSGAPDGDAPPSLRKWTPDHAQAFALFCECWEKVCVPHIRKEEEVLFPALEGFLPRDVGPLAVLRGEHRDFEQHFTRLCDVSESLRKGCEGDECFLAFVREGRETIQLLRDHLYKEEQILFPMVARFLSGVRDTYLARAMEIV